MLLQLNTLHNYRKLNQEVQFCKGKNQVNFVQLTHFAGYLLTIDIASKANRLCN